MDTHVYENLKEHFLGFYGLNKTKGNGHNYILTNKLYKLLNSGGENYLESMRDLLTPEEIVTHASNFINGNANHLDLPVQNMNQLDEWGNVIINLVCHSYRDILVSGIFLEGDTAVGSFMESKICGNCSHRMTMVLGECCGQKQFKSRCRPEEERNMEECF